MLLSPLILTLGAALLKLYPFTGRVVLFLTPCFLIFISFGVVALVSCCKGKIKPLCLIATLGILLIYPFTQTLGHFVDGWDNEEAREAVCYLKNNMLPGDILLMNNSARFSYGYYMGHFQIDMKNRWIGRIWDNLFKDSENHLNARCIFEQLRSDSRGFFIATAYNKNRPVYRIYADKWLDVKYKREWVLLIGSSENLRKFLKSSLYKEHSTAKEFRFNSTSLFLLF